MKRQQIIDTLSEYGFVVLNPASWGKVRLNDGRSGSLYAADNYLSATGDYASFEEKVSPSDRDHKDYPIWRDESLRQVIAAFSGKGVNGRTDKNKIYNHENVSRVPAKERITMDSAGLLLRIARCPNVQKCITASTGNHPCREIVTNQNCRYEDSHVPEPWNGNIATAPILFVSSNPSIDSQEVYPLFSWSDEDIVDYFNNRFSGRWVRVKNNRFYPRRHDGSYARASNYWGKVRNHAEVLLQRNVQAGVDYAITEVVHCKSVEETGVKSALAECAKYLPEVIAVSGSAVVVVLGTKAHSHVRQILGTVTNQSRFAEIQGRYWIFVDHSYTSKVSIGSVLTSDELALVRTATQEKATGLR